MKDKWSAITIFTGSFLLFLVQPMVGRTLLPVFGGTSLVWVVCLCVFQTMLLVGYWYAHMIAGQGVSLSRVRVHRVLLIIAAALTVIVAFAGRGWISTIVADTSDILPPAMQTLVGVLMLAGAPYLLLSANSTLVSSAASGDYRLYSISNVGSFCGLFAYPFLFEPFIGLKIQWIVFAVGIAIYAAMLGCLKIAKSGAANISGGQSADSNPVLVGRCSVAWPAVAFLIPCATTFLLDAFTAHMTLDVMPMPLLWALFLAAFLLSYVIGFTDWAERHLVWFGLFAALGFGAACYLNFSGSVSKLGFPTVLSLGTFFLLAMCTYLHATLYASRPDSSKLSRFYLLNATGGAVGGIAASLVFPLVTKTVAEYPVAVFSSALLAGVLAVGLKRGVGTAKYALKWVGVVILLATGGVLWVTGDTKETRPVVYRGRGFFGTIEVLEAKAKTSASEGRIHEFVHGTTVHGIQVLIPGKERMPTTYYTPDASGYAIVGHPKYRSGQPMRVNITGLGVGVMFAYGRKGDYYRAYEISEDALKVATDTNLFTFVSDCLAEKSIVLGDARKGLEEELAAGVEPYDVIILDAFTGDNLPYHLSTREAYELYFKLLKPDGILCVNITNWHLEMEPLMRTIGDSFHVPLLGLMTRDDYSRLAFGAKIAFFCRKPEGLAQPPFQTASLINFNLFKPLSYFPTDERGSFINLIKW